MEIEKKHIDNLYTSISALIQKSKHKIAVSANSELILLYYKVGQYINKDILNESRADYGKAIIKNLSEKLTENFDKGWGVKHIRHCLRIAETFDEKTIIKSTKNNLGVKN